MSLILKWSSAAIIAATAFTAATFGASAEPMPYCGGLLICAQPAGGETGGSDTSTMGFVGLQWNFGSATPNLTGGVRWLQSGEDDSVYGAKVDASMPLGGDFLPTLRLLGIFGTPTVQGELGAGYDFGSKSAIIGAGVQLPYVNVGTNIGLDGAFDAYVALNSLSRPSFGEGGGPATCPMGYALTPVEPSDGVYIGDFPGNFGSFIASDEYVSNNQTCINMSV